MSAFTYRDNTLFAENCALPDLAATYGTPLYVYSRKALEQHYQSFASAFGAHPHQVCYAVKANSNLAVLNILARQGAGFDIVSGGELERVLRAGGNPDKITFSGVGKTQDEMLAALNAGIHCFNIESASELDLLNQAASEIGKIAPIAFRVNPDVDAKTHPYISTGLKENKFGIAYEDALALYQSAARKPHVNIIGISCHIGSQLTDVTPFIDAFTRVLHLVEQIEANGISLKHIDMGGGLGVVYSDELPPSAGDYVKALLEIAPKKYAIHIEPGRAIAANAGLLLTKVLYLKPAESKNFAIIDAAMNDLIRPSLYDAWQNITAVTQTTASPKKWDLVGPVCETGDFLGKDRELALQQGDLLAVHGAGAYGFTMASNYNTRNRAAEIMVDEDKSYVVRRRETYDDQLLLESLLP